MMVIPKMERSILPQAIALTAITLMFSSTHAATAEQEEIQQLRAEVQALRTLVEQQLSKNEGNKALSIPETAVQHPVASTASNSSNSPLQFKTANGAEAKLYGFVRGDVAYQIEGGKGMFNRINAVSLAGDADQSSTEDRLDSTATTTRLGVDFSTPVDGVKVGGKVEVDFRGSNDSLRVRHAYLTYKNWLFGQTTSTFLATDLQPEMLDFGSPLGIGTFRTPMVRYADQLDSHLEYAVALEKGRDDNRLPALTGKLKTSFADGQGSASVRALVQEVRARDADDETALGWGVGAGISYKLTDALQLMGNYSHVKGDDKFLLYSNSAYNLNTAKDDLNLNKSDAFNVGVSYKISPKLRSTLAYSIVLADNGSDFADMATDAQNETLQQAWFNVMYNPVTPITLGVEYIYGERETFSGKKGQDNRIGAMARYNF